MLTTSSHTQLHTVLPVTSTATPPRVLTEGMTEKERAIFSKLLIDLFLADPRKRPYQQNTSTDTVYRNNETVSKLPGDTHHELTAKKAEEAVQP